jgi:hypothetical protein
MLKLLVTKWPWLYRHVISPTSKAEKLLVTKWPWQCWCDLKPYKKRKQKHYNVIWNCHCLCHPLIIMPIAVIEKENVFLINKNSSVELISWKATIMMVEIRQCVYELLKKKHLYNFMPVMNHTLAYLHWQLTLKLFITSTTTKLPFFTFFLVKFPIMAAFVKTDAF